MIGLTELLLVGCGIGVLLLIAVVAAVYFLLREREK